MRELRITLGLGAFILRERRFGLLEFVIGTLQLVGAGPWSWALILLALIAVPIPYEER